MIWAIESIRFVAIKCKQVNYFGVCEAAILNIWRVRAFPAHHWPKYSRHFVCNWIIRRRERLYGENGEWKHRKVTRNRFIIRYSRRDAMCGPWRKNCFYRKVVLNFVCMLCFDVIIIDVVWLISNLDLYVMVINTNHWNRAINNIISRWVWLCAKIIWKRIVFSIQKYFWTQIP